MPRRKRRRRNPRRCRTQTEQGKALGHLLYDTLILASALVFRNKRYLFSLFDGLQFGIPQSALDVIRLKSRSLIDFFELRQRNLHDEDMLASDFKSVPSEGPHPSDAVIARLAPKIEAINQGAAHLSWQRLTKPLPTERDRRELEEAALALIARVIRFVERGLANRLELDGDAKARRANVLRLYALLNAMRHIDDRTASGYPANERWNLETIT